MLKTALFTALVVTACGGIGTTPVAESSEIKTAQPVSAAIPLPDDPMVDDRPYWGGFVSSDAPVKGLVAHTRGPLVVYEDPNTPEPFMTLDPTTIIGTVTVLGVVSESIDGWLEVMLPVRPNGSTGWVKGSAVDLYVADSEIVVDLTERQLTYTVGGIKVLTTEVGVGSVYNQTPTGEFFVTDNVTLANPNSPWGPHALGLSARSETITEFNGGDGIIGIHGTNNPGSIGGNISLGCVRLPNDMITALHHMVPIGTRVTIEA